ncbi:MAG: lipoprotein [Candidatus Azotimanducaceae bacterium]|uniref:Uncharacterized protein n=1 Tax=OM182 bacterium TaxID=2510334 RepID=A0A520S5L9_9GAMM|nr:hypothetical protein [Gammaproteobacteria bacterium]OUV68409.1 MAG: hypothetical protein CBC93_01620 [Gammaproteobacteria bacterium TMED133]RZO77768.1 MAG: hypothetical protein EVA68_00645 [OM182 bacterium]
MRRLLLILGTLFVISCGQKGDLYLPELVTGKEQANLGKNGS